MNLADKQLNSNGDFLKLLTLLIFFSILTSSCFDSASEEEAGGGLFSGHKAVEDSFSIQVPTSKTYATSENIDFVLIHATNVTLLELHD